MYSDNSISMKFLQDRYRVKLMCKCEYEMQSLAPIILYLFLNKIIHYDGPNVPIQGQMV